MHHDYQTLELTRVYIPNMAFESTWKEIRFLRKFGRINCKIGRIL